MNVDSHVREASASGAVSTLLVRAGAATLWIAAIASIGASAWLGFSYGYQFGLAFGVIAVAAEVFKPVAMQLGLRHLGDWRTAHHALLFLPIAFACMAYSLLAELGLSATGRGDVVAERAAQTAAAGDARVDRKRYLDELAALAPSRSLAEIKAVVDGARTRCRVHVDLTRRETVCAKDAKLLAELGRAQRRADLEAKLVALGGAATVAAKIADPLADALASFYADATGSKPDATVAGRLSKWLSIVPVILIEICSAFGLIVAAAATPATARVVTPTLPATVLGNRRPARLPAIQPRQLLLATRQPSLTDRELVLAVLRNSGRPLSNNELAAAMGCHKSEASRRVAGLNGVVHKVRVGRYVAISLPTTH